MAAARVLVVDNEPVLLDVVDRVLRFAGHETLLASSPVQALEIAGRERVDVVVSETDLPGMSGFQLVQQITRTCSGTAALFMSTLADPAPPLNVDVLRKPFSARELLQRLERALAGSAKVRAVLSRELERANELRAQAKQRVSDLEQLAAEVTENVRLSRRLRHGATARSHHSSGEMLEEYSLARLPEPDCDRIEQHLLVCETCCARQGNRRLYQRISRCCTRASGNPARDDSLHGGWTDPVAGVESQR